MVNRRFVLAAALLALGTLAAPALAFEAKPFDEKAFEAAQAAGKSILIDISAPWCPTCKVQKPILSKLVRDAKFKDLVAFDIDFDSQKDLLRRFGVSMQSTLISFKGAKEVARSTGNTDAAAIEAQLDKSL
jgi:thioredoxin-like negative regulator of GroEL